MSWLGSITERVKDEAANNEGAQGVLDAAKGVIHDHPQELQRISDAVFEQAGKIVGGEVPQESIAAAREAIGSALANFITTGTTSLHSLVYIDNGPISTFDVTSDRTMVFRVHSNAMYAQTLIVTISGPAGLAVARTMFRGKGEGNSMVNEAGQDSWRYRVAGASSASPWKVSMGFYHHESNGSPVPSKAVGSINNCIGSAKSEDALQKPSWVDWNDTIVSVSEK